MQKGFTLVEMVVAVAIIVLALEAMVGAFNLYFQTAYSNARGVEASFLEEEGMEAMKQVRDRGWTTYIAPLSNGSNYYLTFQSGVWQTTTTPAYIDSIFVRTVQLSSVSRDASANIAASGTLDTGTRQVTVSVAWSSKGATTTKTVSTYITNLNND